MLSALQKGLNTPLLIARETKISRTAIYAILKNLNKRGLIKSNIVSGRKYWNFTKKDVLDRNLYELKRTLLEIPEGVEEVSGLSDSTVVVHRGVEAIRKLFNNLFTQYKGERFYAIAGNEAAPNWNKIFSLRETNSFNRAIKKNNIIAENILQHGFLEQETERLGVEWAKDFEGRTARTNLIDQEYFEHGAQIFIFNQSMYLMALGEELVIEIRHSEIQKMILSFFRFIQDNSRTIDVNALLRELIGTKES